MTTPDESTEESRCHSVSDRLAEAARVYYQLAGLAAAGGALARAERFVENAVRLTSCRQQVLAGDTQLARKLATVIEALPCSSGRRCGDR